MSNPSPEIARTFEGSCNHCEAWAFLGKRRLCHPCHIARYDALEDLLEVAAMYKERLPAEVQEAVAKLAGG